MTTVFGFNDFYELTGIDMRVLIMALVPIVILQLILLITGLVSVIRKQVPGEDKIIWIIIIVFGQIIGPIIYFAIGAGKLEQKAAELEEKKAGTDFGA